MMEALEVSCNYYFYEAGRLTGIKAIDEVAKNLGLGEATGVELPEELGYRAVQAQPVDLFPRTAHVETVLRMERRNR